MNRPLRVYLAARFSTKEEMRLRREELEVSGIEVTSHWLDEEAPPDKQLPDVTEDEKRKIAMVDLADISKSDVTVLFTIDPTIPTVRGGRHFESGFAYALSLMQTHHDLITVGPRENVFHSLLSIRNFPSWDEARIWLKRQHEYKVLGGGKPQWN